MPEPLPQQISVNKLVQALSDFCAENQGNHSDIKAAIDTTMYETQECLRTSKQKAPIVVIGAANALLRFIQQNQNDTLHFRKPYPPE